MPLAYNGGIADLHSVGDDSISSRGTKNKKNMDFKCENCSREIVGVGLVHDGHTIHHHCLNEFKDNLKFEKMANDLFSMRMANKEAYKQTILEKWEKSGLLDGLTKPKRRFSFFKSKSTEKVG